MAHTAFHLRSDTPVPNFSLVPDETSTSGIEGARIDAYGADARNLNGNSKPVSESSLKPGETNQLSITVDGQERNFYLHLPKNYDPSRSMPLVIMFNGAGGTPQVMEELTQMSRKADEEGFIVAYPESKGPFGTFNNNQFPFDRAPDDIAFTKAMIDTLSTSLNVDSQRVYLAGFSQGGSFAHLAASQLSDKVAAAAVVSGWTTGHEKAADNNIDILTIHGNEDGLVAYGGTDSLPLEAGKSLLKSLASMPTPAPGLSALYKAAKGDFEPIVSDITEPYRNLFQAGKNIAFYGLQEAGVSSLKPQSHAFDFWTRENELHESWIKQRTDGNIAIKQSISPHTGVEVQQVTILGGEHAWPGSSIGSPIFGDPDKNFKATDHIWDFFKRHTLDDNELRSQINFSHA